MIRSARRPTRDSQSQTVGLFYPGAKKLTQEQEILQELKAVEVRMRDKQPPLSAISPGRGLLLLLFVLFDAVEIKDEVSNSVRPLEEIRFKNIGLC